MQQNLKIELSLCSFETIQFKSSTFLDQLPNSS